MPAPSAAPCTARLLTLCLLLLGLAGCSWLGNNSKTAAPCSGIANQYAASSVSEAQCASDPRGEWFEGRCYCHSSAEDAQR